MNRNSPQQMSFFQLGPQSLELRRQADGLVFLHCYSGGFPVDLSIIASTSQTGAWLMQVLGEQPGPCLVPLSRLTAVKGILAADLDGHLSCTIAPEAAELQLLQPSDAPDLHYRWDEAQQALLRDPGTSWHGQGWLLTGNSYWQWPDLSPEEDAWLGKRQLRGQELVSFLTAVLPGWQSRELPVSCQLSYFSQPLVELTVELAESERVELSVSWAEPPADAQQLAELSGYVLCQDLVRPGLAPQALGWTSLDSAGRMTISGDEIPRLLRELGDRATQMLTGQRERLISQHRLYDDACRLVLCAEREEARGVGTVHAVPSLRVGPLTVPAAELSRQLERGQAWLRVPGGWVSRQQVQMAGVGPYGRTTEGFALDPISLTPSELLWRGSPRLEGPWEELQCPQVAPSADFVDSCGNAVVHLRWLTELGLPGGLLGTVHALTAPLLQFLQGFLRAGDGARRVLVVGTKTVLNYLARLADQQLVIRLDQASLAAEPTLPAGGLVLVTPAALERMPELQQIDWELICLVNADSLVKSRNSRLFGCLNSLHKLLLIGLFSDLGFRQRKPAREAIAQLLEVEEDAPQLIWRYLLRDPAESVRELPPAYRRSRSHRANSLSSLAELGTPYQVAVEANRFVQASRRLAARMGTPPQEPVPFAEYYQYHPHPDQLTPAQALWYCYWREQVRQGKSPDTGLDYLTLFATELINQVTPADHEQTYQLLRQLWLGYRGRFPSLDNTLLNWLVDWLLVYQLPIDPLSPYREAIQLGAGTPYPDILLKDYLQLPLQQLPFYFVERLSTYPISRSRFCSPENSELLRKAVSAALEATDRYYRRTHGQGIWQHFRPRRYVLHQRLPFQHVLFKGRAKLLNFGSALPYSQQPALRALFTAVVKQTENTLRERKGYRGRLRSFQLPVQLATDIEQCLTGLDGPLSRRKVVRVNLDLARVQRLTNQSDEIRSLLLSLTAPSADSTPGAGRHQQSPAAHHAPARLQSVFRGGESGVAEPTDWQQQLLAALAPLERQLLLHLLTAPTGRPVSQLQAMAGSQLLEPLLDHINELALDTVGDLLVVCDDRVWRVDEQYRQGWPISQQTTLAAPVQPNPWQMLLACLSQPERAALALLCRLGDFPGRWRQFCLETGQLPQLLIDRINDCALQTVGDLLLDVSQDDPTVLPEYLAALRQAIGPPNPSQSTPAETNGTET